MEFAAEDIIHWISQFVWPMFRIAALFSTMIVFGSNSIPMTIRTYLVIGMSIVLFPVLPEVPKIDLFSAEAFIVSFNQITIGVLMGFITQMILQVFVVGGQIVAFQTGLGFAQMADPVNGFSVPVIAQFFLMGASLLFITIDGHLIMIDLLVSSFYSIPVSSQPIGTDVLWEIILWSRWMFAGGVLVAISGIFSLLIINLSFGVMTKAAPQINIFAVGFPITMVTGMLIVWLTLETVFSHFDTFFDSGKSLICSVIRLDCS
jgi:flagellar biosynthesis protein FliR